MSKKRKKRSHRFYRRSPPGSPPGTLVIDPRAPTPQIQAFQFHADGFEEVLDTDLKGIAALKKKPGVLWVNVDGTGDPDTVNGLGQVFGLHRLTLEDMVHLHQRTKMESYSHYLYVVVNVLDPMSSRFEQEQISFILGDNFLITVQERPGDGFDPVRKRLRENIGRFRSAGADHLLYALVDTVIDNYFPLAEDLARRIDSLENQILTDSRSDLIHSIHRLKVDVTKLNRTIWNHVETLNTLIREEGGLIHKETVLYLRDCLDHAMQLLEFTGRYREAATSLMDLYLSYAAHRSNEIMRVLTIVASIFIPLTFIAGVYGMNFDTRASLWNMPELRWKFGYPMSLLLMVIVAFGMLYFFHRKNWLAGLRKTQPSEPTIPPRQADAPK